MPVSLFAGRIIADLGHEQRQSVEQGLQSTVRALAIAVEQEMAASIRALEVLATSEALARGDLQAFHRHARGAVALNDLWYVIGLTDPSGRIVLSTGRPYGTALPFIGDRDYIRSALRDARPAVSDLIVGRTTGAMNVSVAVPVRQNGEVRYALFAGINPEALARILAAQRIPATWIAGVADTRQVIVARNRDPRRFVGHELIGPVKEAVRNAPSGTARLPVFDGPDVYAAWQRTSSLGWTVTLGAPVAAVDAAVRRSMWTIAIVGAAVALVSVGMALAIGRRIAGAIGALASAATTLGHGAVPARPPSVVAEVDAVGEAIEVADMTIKARTEELLASQSTVKRLVDSNLIGILVGEAGRILDANEAFLRMVGYTHEDLASGTLRWDVLSPPDYEAADAAAVSRARATGEIVPYEKEYVRKDGTRIPVLVGGAFVDDSRVHWVGFVLDLTEHKRLDAERTLRFAAESASRMKDEFLAVVSHELRTPLAAVLTSIRTLRSGRLGPDQTREAVDRIERNTRLQARLIDDLLDLSRIAAGKLRLERTRVALAPIVRDAAASLRGDADRKGIKLEETIDGGGRPVFGDPERLQQILLNLLTNAIKFTPAGGVVSVSLEARESRVLLRVRDTGIGIDRELLPHLFEPFRQGVAAREHGGLGLGLAIVRHLVNVHGGTVRAESDGLGTGAVFTVDLPAADG